MQALAAPNRRYLSAMKIHFQTNTGLPGTVSRCVLLTSRNLPARSIRELMPYLSPTLSRVARLSQLKLGCGVTGYTNSIASNQSSLLVPGNGILMPCWLLLVLQVVLLLLVLVFAFLCAVSNASASTLDHSLRTHECPGTVLSFCPEAPVSKTS